MTQTILFISLSNIGDAVMTTPVMERLHQLYPEAVMDLVGDRRSSEIFRHCPYLRQLYHKDKRKALRGGPALLRALRRQRYDLIVDLRTDGLAWLLKGRQRFTRWGRRPYGPHAVQDLMSIIHGINPGAQIPPMTLWLSAQERSRATTLLAELSAATPASATGPWLALGPGANWPPKVWAAERFAALANSLGDVFQGVILLGSAADTVRCDSVARALELPHLNLAGQLDLLTATAILEQAALFVGNDSGLGHLASAVSTRCVTVFGPGNPERYHPWGGGNRWLQGENASLEALTADRVGEVVRQCMSTR